MRYKLEDIVDLQIGRTPPRKEFEWFKSNGDGYKWVSIKDMGNCGRFIYNTSEYLSNAAQKRFCIPIVEKGTLLLSFKLTVGRLCIATEKMLTNEAIAQLPIKNEKIVDRDFLYYYLKNYNFHQLGNTSSIATAINSTYLKRMEIDLPQIGQQRVIASVLSSIDDKIANNNAINNNLQQQGMTIIENYSTLTQNEVLLGSLLTFDNGFAFQSSTYLSNGIYRIITIKNVQDGYVNSHDAACLDNLPSQMKSCCQLQIGDALLSLTGNVGRVGIVYESNLLLNQRVAKLVPIVRDYLPFLYFVLRQPTMKATLEMISKGTAQQNLSPVETLKLTIPYNKNTIGNIIEPLKAIYNQIVTLFIENKRLSTLRDTLLPKLMSGEIDVSKVEI